MYFQYFAIRSPLEKDLGHIHLKLLWAIFFYFGQEVKKRKDFEMSYIK